MSWKQAVCVDCYNRDNPDRPMSAYRGDVGEPDQCCKCGARTRSGIYIRIDPALIALTMRVIYERVRGTVTADDASVAAECMNDMPYPAADRAAEVADLANRHLAVLAASYGRRAL